MISDTEVLIKSLNGRNMTQLRQICELNGVDFKRKKKHELIEAITKKLRENDNVKKVKEPPKEPTPEPPKEPTPEPPKIVVPEKVEAPKVKPIEDEELKMGHIEPPKSPAHPPPSPEPEININELEDLILTKEDKDKKFLMDWERKVEEKMREMEKKDIIVKKEKIQFKCPRGINLEDKYILEEIIDELEVLEGMY